MCFIKEVILKSFAIFTRKHLCWSLFLIKGLRRRCFPVNIAKFLRTPILKNICERQLLKINSQNVLNVLQVRNKVIITLVLVGIYLFKVNVGNSRPTCDTCSELTIKTPERNQALFWCLYC